jgi:hypothetical protein
MKPLFVTLKLADPDQILLRQTDAFFKLKGYSRLHPHDGRLVRLTEDGFAPATDDELWARYLEQVGTSIVYWTRDGFEGDECTIGFGYKPRPGEWYSLTLSFYMFPQSRAIGLAAEYLGWIAANIPSLAEDQPIDIQFERSAWVTPPWPGCLHESARKKLVITGRPTGMPPSA